MSAPLLPNPYTSLAWLPPKIADEVEFVRYFAVAVYGAWLWDGMMAIPEDIQLIRKYRFSLADAMYFFARLSVLGCLTVTMLFSVAQVDDCVAIGRGSAWLTVIYLPPNSFLFLLRIRAVFHDSKLVVGFFIFMWLSVIAGTFVQPFCLEYAHIGLSNGCTLTAVHSYCSLGAVALTVYDSLIVVAISLKLLFYTQVDPGTVRYRMIFGGRGMPRISRLLVQTGQQYYIVTAVMNAFTAVVILTPSISPVYRAVIAIPCIAVNNVMACRVYRKVKLGAITNGMTDTLPTLRVHTLGRRSTRFASSLTQIVTSSTGTMGILVESSPAPTAQPSVQPELTQDGGAAVVCFDGSSCSQGGEGGDPAGSWCELRERSSVGVLSESRQEV